MYHTWKQHENAAGLYYMTTYIYFFIISPLRCVMGTSYLKKIQALLLLKKQYHVLFSTMFHSKLKKMFGKVSIYTTFRCLRSSWKNICKVTNHLFINASLRNWRRNILFSKLRKFKILWVLRLSISFSKKTWHVDT